MNVLLVEDDSRVAEFLVRGLAAEGYNVDVCHDGSTGLEYGKLQHFDLIVLDLMLPGMHGFDVCQQLRVAAVKTPLLMLTAMDEVTHKVRGLRLGADDYLTKPFAFSELLARIDALVRRSGTSLPKAAVPQVIADCAAKHDNVRLIDIHGTFLGHGLHVRQFWQPHYDAADPHYWYFDNLEDPNNRGYDAIRRLFLIEMARVLPGRLAGR